MNSIYKIILIAGVSILTLASCKKSFLDRNPTAQAATSEIFTSVEGAEAAVQGIHRTMYESLDHDVFGYPSLALTWDLMGEDMPISGIGSGWFVGSYRYQDSRAGSGTGGYVWTYFYRIIHNANMILDNIGAIEGDQARKDYVKASALFYRAFSYFNLAQCFMFTYADPVTGFTVDVPTPSGTQSLSSFKGASCVPIYMAATQEGNPRSTVQEVYTRITTDLSDAIALFEGAGVTRVDKSAINVSVAKGLYARVALVMQQWDVAQSMATEARSGYSYMTGDQLYQGFSDVNNPEWIWGSIINTEQNGIYASFLSQMDYDMGGYATLGQQKCINRELFNSYLDTAFHDDRRNWWTGRYEKIRDNLPYAQYGQRKFKAKNQSSFAGDFPLMRAGEMALIEAEARTMQEDLTGAAGILNEFVRTRQPGFEATTTSKGELLREIWTQRRIELWGEGFRYFDIMRQQANFRGVLGEEGDISVSGMVRGGKGHDSRYAVVMSITPYSPQFLYRIPSSELLTNDIDQNP